MTNELHITILLTLLLNVSYGNKCWFILVAESDLQDLGEVLDLLLAPELKSLAKTFHLSSLVTQKQQLVDGLLRLSHQKSLFSLAAGQNNIGAIIFKRSEQKRIQGSFNPQVVSLTLLQHSE